MYFSKITGYGSYLPKKIMTNDDISQFVETSDSWIMQRVGIKQRHCADESETTLFMAKEAAIKAIENANLCYDQIDAIIVATGTPDYLMPSTAVMLQGELKLKSVIAFDVSAACSGFVYAMDIAKTYIESGSVKNVLVVASEKMSRVLDWKDRSTCVLFGDGAGAVVLSQSDTQKIFASKVHSDGSNASSLSIPNSLPTSLNGLKSPSPYLQMDGTKVFKHAIQSLSDLGSELLEKAKMKSQDIDWLVPHQANYRILEATAKKLNIPISKVILTLENQGNTSAASIPLALDYAIKNNIIKSGDTILAEAFGAGFVWGGFIAQI